MAFDNTTEPGIRAARASFQAALITFATSTIPSLAQPVHDQVRAASPFMQMFDADEQKIYTDLKFYVDRLIARGLYAGPNPLPLR